MNPCRIAFLSAGLVLNAWGQQTITVNIPANQAWTNTGIYLNAGSTVDIDARGTIEAVSPSDTRPMFHGVPPSGRAERQSNKPQPNMPALVMLARIGNGPVLEAGARAQLRAGGQNGTGELFLGINDDNVADNTGSWTAQVTVTNNQANTSQQRNNGRYQDNPNQDIRSQNNPNQDNRSQNNPNQDNRSQSGRNQDGSSQVRRPSRDNGGDDAGFAIDDKAQELGRSILGAANGNIRATADRIGSYRQYRNGAIYWSPNTGAHAVLGQIYDEWLRRGAESGEMGYPTSDESRGRDGSRVVRFERGTMTWNESTGVRVSRR